MSKFETGAQIELAIVPEFLFGQVQLSPLTYKERKLKIKRLYFTFRQVFKLYFSFKSYRRNDKILLTNWFARNNVDEKVMYLQMFITPPF